MDQKNELVVTAPIQVKRALSPGNIYDLIIADFYTKTRRLSGIKINMPLLWNVNGLPVLKMMKEEGLDISKESRESFVDECIKNGIKLLEKYCITCDSQLRDDQIGDRLSRFIDTNCSSFIHKGMLPIAVCSKCGFDFGTDSAIDICKICGNSVDMKDLDVMYQDVLKDTVSDKISRINIYPDGAKKELVAFNGSMPDRYNICLTKKREYTLSYGGYDLDPRYIVMLTPALIGIDYHRRVYIHGDIIKKFSYYSLCHLPDMFLPTDIVCHGVLLDGYGRKIRWQDQNIDVGKRFDGLSPGDLRAFFLKRNVAKDVLIDFDSIETNLKEQGMLKRRIDRLLLLNPSPSHFSDEFAGLKEEFFKAVENFFYGIAYDKMLLIVKLLESRVPEKTVCIDEKGFLNELRFLYFGKYYGTEN